MRYLIVLIVSLTMLESGMAQTVMGEAETFTKIEGSVESDQTARINSLIKDLSAENWETRDKATDDLKKVGEEAIPALKEAMRNEDHEVAWRAKLIIRSIKKSKRVQAKPERESDKQKSISIWSPQTLSSRIKIFMYDVGAGAKSFSFSTDGSGKVTATVKEETKDGKVEEKTYTADNMEEFKKKYPEIVKKYGIDINVPIELELPEIRIDPDDIWEDFSKSWGRRWDELHKELEAMRKTLRSRDLDLDWFMPRRIQPRKEKQVITGVDDLGVEVEYIEPALRTQLGLDEDNGVLVSKVKADCPGAKIGFQQHDVILEIDDQPVKTIWEFRRFIKEVLDKGSAEILIIRKGEQKILNFKK